MHWVETTFYSVFITGIDAPKYLIIIYYLSPSDDTQLYWNLLKIKKEMETKTPIFLFDESNLTIEKLIFIILNWLV